jgi:hypoxanthine phosphoribosyltransferase
MPNKIDLKLLHVSWDEIQTLTETLASKIISDDYKPDIIVAVSRGGYPPARILCDQLSVRRLSSLQVEYYKGINMVSKEAKIPHPLNADLKGHKVLLVDDVSDSGTSLKLAVEHINELGVGELRVATIHVKPWTTLHPDYYASKVEEWIVYPWEPIEGMNAMASKLLSMDIPEKDIPRKLVELGFNERYLEKLTLRK